MWLNANVTLKYVPMPLQVFSLNVFQLLISFEVVKWGKKKKKDHQEETGHRACEDGLYWTSFTTASLQNLF